MKSAPGYWNRNNRQLMSTGCFKKIPVIAVIAVLMLYPFIADAAVNRAKKQDSWQVRQYLVERLTAECYKINLLSGDLAHVNDIAREIRSLELFPPEVTRIRDDSLVSLDKKTELIEKEARQISDELTALRQPLADGMAILREMVAGQPNEQMFEVLEEGDLQRIDQMIALKHRITAMWKNMDLMLAALAGQMKMTDVKTADDAGAAGELIELVRANLGMQYVQYYNRLNALKDSLAARSAPQQVQAMLRIEINNAKKELGKGRNDVLRSRLQVLIKRYAGLRSVDDLYSFLARVEFESRNFEKTLEAASVLPDSEPAFAEQKTVYTLQSLFELGNFEAIAKYREKIQLDKLSDSHRNLILWILMETSLALGSGDDLTRMASRMVKDAPYAIHVLHALARSYVAAGNWATAISVFESARAIRLKGEADVQVRHLVLLSLAESYYQTAAYSKALPIYFELLNEQGNFEEALYGIVWCYMRTGEYTKAETSLRKLINQSPQSPLAAEAISIMAKRYITRANTEWNQVTALSKEQDRLGKLLEKTNQKMAQDSSKANQQKYLTAATELTDLLAKITGEDRTNYAEIENQYAGALRVSEMLDRYYRTGTFQENELSLQREKLLHNLDSVLAEIRDDGQIKAGMRPAFAQQRENIQQIKDLVRKNTSLKARIYIDQFRWERDYIDWLKMIAKNKQDSLNLRMNTARDSSEQARIALKKAACGNTIDSLVTAGDSVEQAGYLRLNEACAAVLAQPIDPEDEAYIRYHMAEMQYTNENERYLRSYDAYEDQKARYDTLLAAFRNGIIDTMPVAPSAPELDHSQSMQDYFSLLEKFPQSAIVPAVYYSLAWCYSDMSKPEMAVAQMETLAVNFPQSQYTPQAWMFVGEYLFDHDNLEKAVKAYQNVMKYPDNKWFDDALYKLAWTQYRLSNPEKAISSFLALVDLGGGKIKGKSVLEKESMDYIALSFSESDMTGEKGLERATRFVQKFGDEVRGSQILHRLAKVYRDQGRYDMAKQSYKTLLTTYPNNTKNPLVEREYLGVLAKELPDTTISKLRIDFFNKYNSRSSWARAQTDSLVKAEGDSLSSQMLYDAAVAYHQLALGRNDTSWYNQALRVYKDYIKAYPLSRKANECHYNLAEIVFSLGDYRQAAEEYIAVSKRYPDSKYRETAAWNAIVASQNLLKKEKPVR
jgi:TolA-binding protein